MRAGALRHLIDLQAPAHIDDTNAGQISAWTSLGTFAAEVLPTGGNKVLEGTIVMGVQGWKVRMRYRTGIDVTHRIVWEGRELAIVSIEDPDGRKRELLAFCQSGVPT